MPGDYDGDRRPDLAVGAPRSIGSSTLPGMVFTRDSVTGARAAHSVPFVDDGRWDGLMVGELVVSCDLNGDRFADLVTATWYDTTSDDVTSVGVQVFLGSPDGLQYSHRLTERAAPVDVAVEALACGDVDGDGFDEVALGTPSARVAGKADAGEVFLYRGGPEGPTTAGRRIVTQEHPGLPARSEKGDAFGESVVFADLNGDGDDELVVGAPRDQPPSGSKDPRRQGALAILRGGSNGLSAHHAQYLYGADLHITGNFGWSLAAGDLNGDGKDDLGVGAIEHLVGGSSIGAVAVLEGSTGRIRLDELVTQADKDVPGAPGPENAFGARVAVGDVTGDRRADLVVGAPGQTVDGHSHAGSVTVLPGSKAGVDRRKSQFVTLASHGVAGAPETGASWPTALGVVDTSGDGRAEVYAALGGDPGKGPGAVYRLPGSTHGVVVHRTARLTPRDLEPAPQHGLRFARSLG